MKLCYNYYLSKVEANIAKNPKKFWKIVKDKRKGDNSLPNIFFSNNLSEDTGSGIGNFFAKHFSSVYNNHASIKNTLHSVPNKSQHHALGHILFTENDILKNIKRLDISKGAGSDMITPVFDKRCDKFYFKFQNWVTLSGENFNLSYFWLFYRHQTTVVHCLT